MDYSKEIEKLKRENQKLRGQIEHQGNNTRCLEKDLEQGVAGKIFEFATAGHPEEERHERNAYNRLTRTVYKLIRRNWELAKKLEAETAELKKIKFHLKQFYQFGEFELFLEKKQKEEESLKNCTVAVQTPSGEKIVSMQLALNTLFVATDKNVYSMNSHGELERVKFELKGEN